jgi:hypothetical protein
MDSQFLNWLKSKNLKRKFIIRLILLSLEDVKGRDSDLQRKNEEHFQFFLIPFNGQLLSRPRLTCGVCRGKNNGTDKSPSTSFFHITLQTRDYRYCWNEGDNRNCDSGGAEGCDN